MNSRLALGRSVGVLEVIVDGVLKDRLDVKFFKNGKTYYKIFENSKTKLSKETDILNTPYRRKEFLIDDIRDKAVKTYSVPVFEFTTKYAFTFQRPKVEVNYKNCRDRGIEDQEKALRGIAKDIHTDYKRQPNKYDSKGELRT